MPETKMMTTAEHLKDEKAAADKAAADKAAAAAVVIAGKPSETKVNLGAKPDESKATSTAPFPTQADADAIKDGTYRKKREAAPEAGSVEYKTR